MEKQNNTVGVSGCSGVFRGVPECSGGVPVFRCSGVPVFRCSGVPVFLVLVHAKFNEQFQILPLELKVKIF